MSNAGPWPFGNSGTEFRKVRPLYLGSALCVFIEGWLAWSFSWNREDAQHMFFLAMESWNRKPMIDIANRICASKKVICADVIKMAGGTWTRFAWWGCFSEAQLELNCAKIWRRGRVLLQQLEGAVLPELPATVDECKEPRALHSK
jgi:hypothetical protein